MKINGYGRDIAGSYIYGDLGRLEAELDRTAELGFDVAEIGITGTSAIINGQLVPQQVDTVQSVLADFDLRYTVHAPNRTNLAFSADLELERAILQGCLEFCDHIGATVLVYHSGLQALNAAATGTSDLPDDAALARGMEREVTALRDLAPVADERGVTIAMENGDPHLWEYAILRANNRPPTDLSKYHDRLRTPPIVSQLEAVGHPRVGMTLDVAHLHLACHVLGMDYLEAVRQAAPWVRHLHVNDNFGKLDSGFVRESDRLPYGEADLHLPPGWGRIPLADAFAQLDSYTGDLILEIKRGYWPHLAEALATTRQLVMEA